MVGIRDAHTAREVHDGDRGTTAACRPLCAVLDGRAECRERVIPRAALDPPRAIGITGLDGDRVWMTCTCGAIINRHADRD
jgi:hypothetical protein